MPNDHRAGIRRGLWMSAVCTEYKKAIQKIQDFSIKTVVFNKTICYYLYIQLI